MTATLHRGHCAECGWHGRALADQRRAEWAAARHWQRTGHSRTSVQQAPRGVVLLPGSWAAR